MDVPARLAHRTDSPTADGGDEKKIACNYGISRNQRSGPGTQLLPLVTVESCPTETTCDSLPPLSGLRMRSWR